MFIVRNLYFVIYPRSMLLRYTEDTTDAEKHLIFRKDGTNYETKLSFFVALSDPYDAGRSICGMLCSGQ